MRRPLTTLLFDLDGTLIDSMGLIFTSYRHALREVLGEVPSEAALMAIFGKPLRRSLAELAAGQTGLPLAQLLDEASEAQPLPNLESAGSPDEALVERLIRVYRHHNLAHHNAMVSCYAGVRETLAELRQRGYTLAVVTSKGRHTADLSLRHCGLEEFMTTSVALEDVSRHKPDPAPLQLALRRLGRAPEEALYLGDSHVDVLAAQAAGTRSAAALWGPFPREELLALGPDHPLESIEDLLAICPPLSGVLVEGD
ncbi:MAG: HAD-IA family hydrolase [Chloroflexota bacterium]